MEEMREALLADALKHNPESKYVNGHIWFNKECDSVVLESHIKLTLGKDNPMDIYIRLSTML
jgi:hypothetical protein